MDLTGMRNLTLMPAVTGEFTCKLIFDDEAIKSEYVPVIGWGCDEYGRMEPIVLFDGWPAAIHELDVDIPKCKVIARKDLPKE